MSVKLVSFTEPTSLMEGDFNGNFKIISPEELIVYIARVSNPSNQMNMETAPKLINYLIKHKHWSPFELLLLLNIFEKILGMKMTCDEVFEQQYFYE